MQAIHFIINHLSPSSLVPVDGRFVPVPWASEGASVSSAICAAATLKALLQPVLQGPVFALLPTFLLLRRLLARDHQVVQLRRQRHRVVHLH